MDHADHVALISKGIGSTGGVWADLGSGWGAFTLALADVIGSGGEIFSIDRDASAILQQEQSLASRFPMVHVHYIVADFMRPLQLPPLDGIVMANALHFVPREKQEGVVRLLMGYLKPEGRLILVEYDADQGNIWVPNPLSYPTWKILAQRAGFGHTVKLNSHPSHFLRAIYSALSLR